VFVAKGQPTDDDVAVVARSGVDGGARVVADDFAQAAIGDGE
jgi:hypothetical protein